MPKQVNQTIIDSNWDSYKLFIFYKKYLKLRRGEKFNHDFKFSNISKKVILLNWEIKIKSISHKKPEIVPFKNNSTDWYNIFTI